MITILQDIYEQVKRMYKSLVRETHRAMEQGVVGRNFSKGDCIVWSLLLGSQAGRWIYHGVINNQRSGGLLQLLQSV